jgi:hypothetical protein
MAVLTSNNATALYQRGDSRMTCLFGLRNVTTADTLDIATISAPAFQVIDSAVVLGDSQFVAIAANFAGTVVTMPPGLNKASAYLLVIGC